MRPNYGVLIVALSLLLIPFVSNTDAISTESVFQLSVSPDILTDYGLRYPVTYMFSIPSSASNISVFYKYHSDDSWIALPEKISKNATSPTTIYNGINCYRCDYPNDTLIVNIGFSTTTNIFLKITNNDSNIVNDCSFLDIPKYYDNRKAAVTITWDDWRDGHNESFVEACNIVQARNLWASPGIITRYDNVAQTMWGAIQLEVNEGNICPVSHTRTHPHVPYPDYDSEINGSKQDILDNITLPYGQYVYALLYPYGEEDSTTHAKCGEYKYLVDRDTYFGSSSTDFSSWDATNNIFAESKPTIRMGDDGTSDINTLNNAFDTKYNAGGVYHVMSHPYEVNWDSYGKAHYSYISNHTDVWYVGYGLMYMYHYVDDRGVVSVSKTQVEMSASDTESFGVSLPIDYTATPTPSSHEYSIASFGISLPIDYTAADNNGSGFIISDSNSFYATIAGLAVFFPILGLLIYKEKRR